MKNKTARHTPLLFVCISLLLASMPLSADPEGTLNLYLNGGKYWFDSQRLDGTPFNGLELEDTSGGGIGLGYNITDRWILEGVYDYFTADVSVIDDDVVVQNYHLDLMYQFAGQLCGNPLWQPYVALGVGNMRIDYDGYYSLEPDTNPNWHERQTMVNFGVGVKYALGPRWQARADARGFQGVEDGGLDSFLSFSIGYQWGDAPVVRDRDIDGIYDDVDQCPQTPAGVSVDDRGCPLDSDADGVPDYMDRCPYTPVGAPVNEEGCPAEPT